MMNGRAADGADGVMEDDTTKKGMGNGAKEAGGE